MPPETWGHAETTIGASTVAGGVSMAVEVTGRDDDGGDGKFWLGVLPVSKSAPPVLLLTLFSLSIWLLSLFSLLLSPDTDWLSEVACALILGGAFHRGISQTTPVNVFILNPPFAHLRQGLPVRSRARNPALIAPWLALGPSLCAALAARGTVAEWSMEPSSLWCGISICVKQLIEIWRKEAWVKMQDAPYYSEWKEWRVDRF